MFHWVNIKFRSMLQHSSRKQARGKGPSIIPPHLILWVTYINDTSVNCSTDVRVDYKLHSRAPYLPLCPISTTLFVLPHEIRRWNNLNDRHRSQNCYKISPAQILAILDWSHRSLIEAIQSNKSTYLHYYVNKSYWSTYKMEFVGI